MIFLSTEKVLPEENPSSPMVHLKQLEQDMQQHLRGYYGSVSAIDFSFENLTKKTKSKAEANMANALKHRIAERHRRKRISQQFDMLRTILPNLIKMDKASVLGETVRLLKELKRRVKQMKGGCHGSLEHVLPGESNNLSLDYCEKDRSMVKVTFSCDDRPELITDLTREVRKAKGTVVRAEMVFIGGRNKSVLWIKGFSGNEGIGMLKRALKMVTDGPKKKNGEPRFTL
ncbi:hypothetical protein V6N11_078258 [Hibiscus sabdariffa]|uniref:BHLH domain-containing protein n=1 Tax=Hibiscus sabdariffa TaxID=183260 RepID=A0ABR2TFH5_9ROSI